MSNSPKIVVSFFGIPYDLKQRLSKCTNILSKHAVASLLNLIIVFLVTIVPCPRLVYREEAFYCEIMYIISISIGFYSRELLPS